MIHLPLHTSVCPQQINLLFLPAAAVFQRILPELTRMMPTHSPLDSEKQPSSSGRTSNTIAKSGDAPGPSETGAVHDEGKLVMNEHEALERARRFPDKQEPIYLCYSAHDTDNPRNWSTAKRWYVTCLVCWFNVLT